MVKNINDYITRIEELIHLGRTARSSQNNVPFLNFRTSGLSMIKQIYGYDYPYYTDFETRVQLSFRVNDFDAGIGILEAIKSELEGGWLTTVKGIVSAEIFSDYLDMATHLLQEDYKDAAAVMIGSTLEAHLRQLCQKHGIDIEIIKRNGNVSPKKADRMNSDLVKAGVYGRLDQKSITAWLDIRNKAAHGKYKEYSKEQVELMLQGVLEFLKRNPL